MKKEKKEEIVEALEKERDIKSIEDELYRELGTMEKDDLIDLVVSYMGDKSKRNFVKDWNKY